MSDALAFAADVTAETALSNTSNATPHVPLPSDDPKNRLKEVTLSGRALHDWVMQMLATGRTETLGGSLFTPGQILPPDLMYITSDGGSVLYLQGEKAFIISKNLYPNLWTLDPMAKAAIASSGTWRRVVNFEFEIILKLATPLAQKVVHLVLIMLALYDGKDKLVAAYNAGPDFEYSLSRLIRRHPQTATHLSEAVGWKLFWDLLHAVPESVQVGDVPTLLVDLIEREAELRRVNLTGMRLLRGTLNALRRGGLETAAKKISGEVAAAADAQADTFAAALAQVGVTANHDEARADLVEVYSDPTAQQDLQTVADGLKVFADAVEAVATAVSADLLTEEHAGQ